MDYSLEVKLPPMTAINGGMTYPKPSQMISLLGSPRKSYTDDCAAVTNPTLAKKMVYGFDVGPFNVSGLQLVAESLKRVFTKVRANNPELYNQVGTAGMLCVRRIRGSSSTPSNHSWGAAIDFKINGKLDQRGDGHCQKGLLELYPYMHNEGFFWGAEYRGSFEDAMHYEWAWETLVKNYGK